MKYRIQHSVLLLPILILVFGINSAFTQTVKIDSLNSILEGTLEDDIRFDVGVKLCMEYVNQDRNATLAVAHELLDIAEGMNDAKRKIRALNLLGFSYLALSKNDSVIHLAESSNQISTEIGDSSWVISNLNNIALAYQRSNKYELATTTYHQVIESALTKAEYHNSVIGLVNIASVQMNQDNYQLAIDYLNRVDEIYNSITNELVRSKFVDLLEILRKRKDISNATTYVIDSIKNRIDRLYPNVYVNKGMCYNELGNDVEALDAFEKTIESCLKLDASYTSDYITAYANHSIGDIYEKYANNPTIENAYVTNWQIAKRYYEKAYEGFENIGFDRGRTFVLVALGKSNTELGNTEVGEAQLQEALELANELNFIEEKVDALDWLATNAGKKGDFRQAFSYLGRHISHKDSLRNAERDEVIQEFEIKYETAQKEKDIAQLNHENELKTRQQRFQLTLFVIGILVILALSAFLYMRYRYTQQKKAAQYERELSTAMNRFVPNEFIKAIGRNHILDVNLGDQIEKEISVVFTDVRSFTTISEKMTPKENFGFVKNYAEKMGPVIHRNKGFVSQYLGDGIMAIFQYSPDDALLACIEMQVAIDEFNEDYKDEEWAPIRVGMGIHTGPLIMGIIGDDERRDATLISDTVNTAARLESTTKKYGVKILISENSKKALQNREKFYLRHIGGISVKGKTKPVHIYECMNSDNSEMLSLKLKTLNAYNEALESMTHGHGALALTKFEGVLQENPDDAVVQSLIVHNNTAMADDRSSSKY